MSSHRFVLALLLILPALQGCSKEPAAFTSAMSETPAPDARTSTSQPQQTAKACELVTEKEMSAILGAPMRAEPTIDRTARPNASTRPSKASVPISNSLLSGAAVKGQ